MQSCREVLWCPAAGQVRTTRIILLYSPYLLDAQEDQQAR